MKVVRWILGQVILLLDALTSPKPVAREVSAQKVIDDVTASMAMYQFKTCPFCVKVRRELKRQSLNIELRDAKNDLDIKSELVREGGRHKVPCWESFVSNTSPAQHTRIGFRMPSLV